MKYFRLSLFFTFLGICCVTQAQSVKKAMSWEDVVSWKQISDKAISDDGKWVACRIASWRGDASVTLYNAKGEEKMTFKPAEGIVFSSSSSYLLVTQKPTLKEVEELKLKKTKEDKMPMNKLVIYSLTGNKKEVIDSLKSYKLSESGDWIAYLRGGKADSSLYVRSLNGDKSFSFPKVADFGFAKKENVLYYVTTDSVRPEQNLKAGLYTFTPERGSLPAYQGNGVFKKVTFSETGSKLGFVYCADKDSTATGCSLFVSENGLPARQIADRNNKAFPAGWVISENENLQFSKDARRLFFGTAPEPRQKDTTVLAENRPNVQVWNWNEGTQYTQQVNTKAQDLKKAYAAVYNFESDKLLQLATPEQPDLIVPEEGKSPLALLITSKPYDLESMWTGRKILDVYQINMESGLIKPVKKALNGSAKLSPEGQYAYWYSDLDSSWYTYSMAEGKEYRLTHPERFIAWDEENDVPDYPASHGVGGWTTGDKSLLIYDRYDIWKFDPAAAAEPVNLTIDGRNNKIVYRLVRLDKDEKSVDPKKQKFLSGFNQKTKGSGYYQADFSSPASPKVLLAGNFMLKPPLKAKKADALIYTIETFSQYPDIRLSDLSFRKSKQLTHESEQQAGFNWGTAELVSWVSLDGTPLEGVVYKPADFDPAKKYPVIVNFYERNSETLYAYHMPEPGRSTIDYHLYNSNGYIIFNPDVRYKNDGYPGESCYNCVMPGIASLIAKGYVNEKAIGAQGHSWGGYQVAYLATRTNLFAAIESGAPVVNMLSAYGGIRWGTGLNRSFQYEHEQSRIGGTIWEMPLRYMANSPLLRMDKVQTPILIMHNDNDGHVPWYQGIEFFVALKRLQKPVWLLNYTGEVHWPLRMANRIDFQKRMFQFFEHYLHGKPMPVWMSEGVPAVDQEFELGY